MGLGAAVRSRLMCNVPRWCGTRLFIIERRDALISDESSASKMARSNGSASESRWSWRRSTA